MFSELEKLHLGHKFFAGFVISIILAIVIGICLR